LKLEVFSGIKIINQKVKRNQRVGKSLQVNIKRNRKKATIIDACLPCEQWKKGIKVLSVDQRTCAERARERSSDQLVERVRKRSGKRGEGAQVREKETV